MKFIKRLSAILVAAFVLVLVASVAAIADPATGALPSKAAIRIGAILPLTGPIAFQGSALKNAMEMAAEEWGDGAIQIFFEDDGFQAARAVSAYRKLRAKEDVQFLAVFGANQGVALAEIAEQDRFPLAVFSVLSRIAQDKHFVTLFMPTCESLTNLSIREAARRGYRRVAILASIQDATICQRDWFSSHGRFELVANEEVDPASGDLRPVLTKLRVGRPDAIFLSLLPPQGGLVAKLLRSSGYTGPLFGGLQLGSLTELKSSDGALLGAWVVAGDDRPAAAFRERYGNRFGEPPTAESFYGYDLVKLLAQAVKSGKPANDYLHSVEEFSGILGTYGADGKNSFTFHVVAKEFVREGFHYLGE